MRRASISFGLDQPGRFFWLLVRDTARHDNMIRETWGWMHYAFCGGFPGLSSARRSSCSTTGSPRRPDFSVFPIIWWA